MSREGFVGGTVMRLSGRGWIGAISRLELTSILLHRYANSDDTHGAKG